MANGNDENVEKWKAVEDQREKILDLPAASCYAPVIVLYCVFACVAVALAVAAAAHGLGSVAPFTPLKTGGDARESTEPTAGTSTGASTEPQPSGPENTAAVPPADPSSARAAVQPVVIVVAAAAVVVSLVCFFFVTKDWFGVLRNEQELKRSLIALLDREYPLPEGSWTDRLVKLDRAKPPTSLVETIGRALKVKKSLHDRVLRRWAVLCVAVASVLGLVVAANWFCVSFCPLPNLILVCCWGLFLGACLVTLLVTFPVTYLLTGRDCQKGRHKGEAGQPTARKLMPDNSAAPSVAPAANSTVAQTA